MSGLVVFLTEFLAPLVGELILECLIYFFPNKREGLSYFFGALLIVLSFSIGAISGFLYPAILVKWPLVLLLNFIITPVVIAYIIVKMEDFFKHKKDIILQNGSYWFIYLTILVFMVGRFAAGLYL